MTRVVLAAAALAAGCLPPAGLETARVGPRGTGSLTVGGEIANTTGKRHDYQLRDRAGNVASVDHQHQPWLAGEGSLVGRGAVTPVSHLEIEVSGWNPLILPPFSLGGSAGAKLQLLGGQDGRVAGALGARAHGFVHSFGDQGNSRTTMLGALEGRAVVSLFVAPAAAVTLSPRIQLEAVRDSFTDTLHGPETTYKGTSSRWVPGLTLGLMVGSWSGGVDASFGRQTGDDPDFVRIGLSLGRRLER